MDVITNFYGNFDIASIPFLVPGIICLYLGFAYFSIPILFYFIPAVILGFLLGLSQLSWAILIGLILISASPLRRYLLSAPIFTAIKAFNILPNISDTEKEEPDYDFEFDYDRQANFIRQCEKR